MTKEQQPYQPMTIDVIAGYAKETALQENGHAPVLIAEGDREMVVAVFEQPSPTFELRQLGMYQAGLTLARSGRIGILRQVFFISEAWMSLAKEKPEQPVSPADDPDRKEVLIVTSLTMQDLHSELVIFEMVRNEQDHLQELRAFQTGEAEGSNVESPLLEAFVAGYWSGIGGRLN